MPAFEPLTVAVLALLLFVWALVKKPVGIGAISVPPLPTVRHRWIVGVLGFAILLSAISWALSGPLSFLGSWRGTFTYTSESVGTRPISMNIRLSFFRLVVSESGAEGSVEPFYATYKDGQLVFGDPSAQRTLRVLGPNTITGEVRRSNGGKLGELVLHPANGG